MTFSSKEASEKVASSSISKVITPGNVVAKLLDIKLETPPYDSNALTVTLMLETEKVEDPSFTGLLIDKNNPELGNHQGQVARVQSSPYSYSDYTSSKDGKVSPKEDQIFSWIWNFAKELGVSEQLVADNVEGETIVDYVDAVKKYLVSPTRLINFCIGGAEYENKEGYTQHRLYLLKNEKNVKSYAKYVEGEEPRNLIKFNADLHIRKKKVAEKVESFEGRDTDLDV